LENQIDAKIAKKEGYEQISEIFLITADNEREHAKWLFRLINELKHKFLGRIDMTKARTHIKKLLSENIK